MNALTKVTEGSVKDIMEKKNISLAEAFINVEKIVIVDVSGSMDAGDARGGRTRYAVACEELARIQADYPGRVGVVAFSDTVEFCPGGVPPFMGQGTDLARALTYVRQWDGGVDFIVISDGYPQDAEAALRVARALKSKIDCVFVGPEGDSIGQGFLKQLAQAKNGVYILAERTNELAIKVERQLMLSAG